ncbi:phosphoribosyl-ATP pyrophosphatase [Kiloniella litopenaei]|uniref:Phosphoribosyl-ATP pyrophosphatase n=1 Tax=Kiloniella litopenaei TaxID=1549748 RepID=A0A0M2RC09_9PROT|nr:phosphoribosyl-ATP diphosphatase [Kiloniella litopenaei]KKJ77138.1 phosphoribosyl-ATP pyrophosphatase [Kiloniella litopenaei]
MAKKKLSADILDELHHVIVSRKGDNPEESHTARLFSKGINKIAQKVGEEAVETVIEAVGGSKEELAAESADLLYHLLVLWEARGLKPCDVWEALEGRKGISGIAEKASRIKY